MCLNLQSSMCLRHVFEFTELDVSETCVWIYWVRCVWDVCLNLLSSMCLRHVFEFASFDCPKKRSIRPEVFCKKGFLRNFAKFTGKHLCQSLFFNKVADLRWLLLKESSFHCFCTLLQKHSFSENFTELLERHLQ